MYICNCCGETTRELPEYTEDFGFETGVGYKSMEQTFVGECSCGGTFVDAKQCEICGEWEDPDNLVEDICERCFDEESTFANAISFVAENKEYVEINGYLASEFTPEQIEKILLKELEEAKKLGIKTKHKEFCLKDKEDFSIFLKESFAKSVAKCIIMYYNI